MQQPTDSLTAVTNPDTVYITTVQGQSSGNVSDVCVAVKTLVKYENVIPKE